jgi:hypothetical protein
LLHTNDSTEERGIFDLKPHPTPLHLHMTSAPCSLAELAKLPAEEVVAVEEEEAEDQLPAMALWKYKQLPGGFMVQQITATGRRKTDIARVCCRRTPARSSSTSTTLFCTKRELLF